MPTTGLFRVRLPVLPQKSCPKAKIPPSEATVRYPFCAAAGRSHRPRGLLPPTNPVRAASWWNCGQPPGPSALAALDPATWKCWTMPWTALPPMPKYPATVMPIAPSASARDERGVLEAVDLTARDAAVAGAVVDVGHELAAGAVEDEQAMRRRDDHVLGAAPEVGGRHRADDLAGREMVLPDDATGGAVQGVDRSRAVLVVRSLHHGELPIALHVRQGGAPVREPVQRGRSTPGCTWCRTP